MIHIFFKSNCNCICNKLCNTCVTSVVSSSEGCVCVCVCAQLITSREKQSNTPNQGKTTHREEGE